MALLLIAFACVVGLVERAQELLGVFTEEEALSVLADRLASSSRNSATPDSARWERGRRLVYGSLGARRGRSHQRLGRPDDMVKRVFDALARQGGAC